MRNRLLIALTTMIASIGFVLTMARETPALSTASTAAVNESDVTSVVSPALPQAADLSFGQNAGNDLIGLTVRPAAPGPNTVLVYVLPLEGSAAAAAVPVTLMLDEQRVDLEMCSSTCRTANVDLVGGERIQVATESGTASFELPDLPTQDGTELLQQVHDRMHQLHSYRVDETLGPATPALQAAYLFEAPDRMQITPVNGETTVWIGPKRYTRPVNSDSWQVDDFGSGLPVPSFIWDIPEYGGHYTEARRVGSETVDGVQTSVLTFFFDLPQTPVWFRLWVDADGLVHRASMRAQGHFMEHTYSRFDAPLSIEAPA